MPTGNRYKVSGWFAVVAVCHYKASDWRKVVDSDHSPLIGEGRKKMCVWDPCDLLGPLIIFLETQQMKDGWRRGTFQSELGSHTGLRLLQLSALLGKVLLCKNLQDV